MGKSLNEEIRAFNQELIAAETKTMVLIKEQFKGIINQMTAPYNTLAATQLNVDLMTQVDEILDKMFYADTKEIFAIHKKRLVNLVDLIRKKLDLVDIENHSLEDYKKDYKRALEFDTLLGLISTRMDMANLSPKVFPGEFVKSDFYTAENWEAKIAVLRALSSPSEFKEKPPGPNKNKPVANQAMPPKGSGIDVEAYFKNEKTFYEYKDIRKADSQELVLKIDKLATLKGIDELLDQFEVLNDSHYRESKKYTGLIVPTIMGVVGAAIVVALPVLPALAFVSINFAAKGTSFVVKSMDKSPQLGERLLEGDSIYEINKGLHLMLGKPKDAVKPHEMYLYKNEKSMLEYAVVNKAGEQERIEVNDAKLAAKFELVNQLFEAGNLQEITEEQKSTVYKQSAEKGHLGDEQLKSLMPDDEVQKTVNKLKLNNNPLSKESASKIGVADALLVLMDNVIGLFPGVSVPVATTVHLLSGATSGASLLQKGKEVYQDQKHLTELSNQVTTQMDQDATSVLDTNLKEGPLNQILPNVHHPEPEVEKDNSLQQSKQPDSSYQKSIGMTLFSKESLKKELQSSEQKPEHGLGSGKKI